VRIVVLEFGLGRVTIRDPPEVDRLDFVLEFGLGRVTARDHSEVERGRRRPGSARERPQAFRARAPRSSASVPARESPSLVLPVGPGRRFSARDPASPGVACSTLVPPARAVSKRAGGQVRALRVPRGTQAISLKSVPHGCNRAAVSLAPSESVARGTRAVSPRAWLGAARWRRAP
jgi:hypothetical protein